VHPIALALALTAAVLHSGWNLVVKSTPDRILGAWHVSGGAGLINVVVLAVVGLPDRQVWWLVLLSSVIQTAYMLLLATAYRVGDMSFVYPIARGSAPLFITAAGILLLSDEVVLLAGIGVVVVALSLGSLAVGASSNKGLGWALATGATVAAYTTVDAASVRIQGSAIPVVAAVFVVHAVMLTAVVAITRGRAAMAESLRDRPLRAGIGAVGSALSYLTVMAATLYAPVGPVTAVREISVILVVAAGRLMLKEPVTRPQLIAIGGCLSGIVMIAVS
jgi:drug/metabolite transporter (DMT)-like permease